VLERNSNAFWQLLRREHQLLSIDLWIDVFSQCLPVTLSVIKRLNFMAPGQPTSTALKLIVALNLLW
jgi:hypothetical protein